ncbi:hypothetical protein [Propionibacterium australiense]|uniref:Uncharacterized protein n=1 Tax=Propionibacterium australiense TaxID=119981 RepID=A0A8B3FU14_9ACTN|nr:hypothetical protein [Propionibacterium australiense]RLP12262.1 hypothetical protein D7U36_03105 [Propionibacterium australiense]
MARVKLHLDYGAIRQVLLGQAEGIATAEMIGNATRNVRDRAGEGFESTLKHGPQRLSGRVWTRTAKAKAAQARNHTLEKAIGGGL